MLDIQHSIYQPFDREQVRSHVQATPDAEKTILSARSSGISDFVMALDKGRSIITDRHVRLCSMSEQALIRNAAFRLSQSMTTSFLL